MRKLIALLLTLAASGTLLAQNFITFTPLNSMTKQPLDSVVAQLTLTRGDSTVIWATDTLRPYNNADRYSYVYPKGAGTFTLTLSAPDYVDSTPRTFTVKKTTAYYHTDLGNIMLDRDFSRELKEVTVTATKIKMVMKGDTIVYNADAFKLAEGSVLDELIRQLPGAELSNDGVIKVNGKAVSSLLVNGRDFFKGDPMVALKNLPAYTVNTVKVYEKEPDYASLVKTNDKKPEYPLVMDVNLKKQFNVGWLGNAEGGYGTHNRYIGRAFAVGYTNSMRIGLFANINNISNSSSAANNGEWDQGWGASGRLNLKFFGANVNWENKQEKYTHKIDGSVKVTREDQGNDSGSASTTYYESGDRYGRSQSGRERTNTHVWVDGTYSLRAPRYYLRVSPYWEYMHITDNTLSRSATFTEMPYESYRTASVDSLFMAPASKELERITLHRSQNIAHSINNTHYMRLNWNWRYRRFNFIGSESYYNGKTEGHSIYSLHYTDPALQSGDSYQRIYTPKRQNDYTLTFSGDYNFWAGSESKFVHWQFIPSYGYRREHRSSDNPRYRLDRLDGWGEDSDRELTATPSASTELELALDRQNSQWTTKTTDRHTPGLKAIYGIFWRDERDRFYVIPEVGDEIFVERMHYFKPMNNTDLHLHRTTHNVKPRINISFTSGTKEYEYSIAGNYDYSQTLPDMLDMVETLDDANPLYVRMGNPNLKRGHYHSVWFYGSYSNIKHQAGAYFNGSYSLRRGMTSMAQFYNPETGVTVARPANINGNWNANFTATGYKNTSKTRASLNLRMNYDHSMDYISETAEPQRSLVHNWNVAGGLNFDLDFAGRNTVKLTFTPAWMRQYSRRRNFAPTSAWDFNYGITIELKDLLPWKMEFSTSLQMRSRAGYNSAEMNKTEYVWNARLSKVIASKWTVSIDGFDILGSVKNISRQLNSQGYYESWYSALPSYLMLKVAYRFQIFPKNHGKQDKN